MDVETCGVRLSLVMTLLLAVVVGCSEIGIAVDTPAPPSGIRGIVLLGPTCPVSATPGDDNPVPCVTPYATNLVVLNAESAVVARVSSGADGTFQLELPPGEYVVTPATGADTYAIAQPVSVTVLPGAYVDVEINYNTGIL